MQEKGKIHKGQVFLKAHVIFFLRLRPNVNPPRSKTRATGKLLRVKFASHHNKRHFSQLHVRTSTHTQVLVVFVSRSYELTRGLRCLRSLWVLPLKGLAMRLAADSRQDSCTGAASRRRRSSGVASAIASQRRRTRRGHGMHHSSCRCCHLLSCFDVPID